MITFDHGQRKTAFALFVVALVAASMLALVDQLTREPIAQAQRDALHRNLVQVLPEHQNDPLKDMFQFKLSETNMVQIFPAKSKQGKIIAYAWEQISSNGYSGTIRILMGVRTSGEVVAIRITDHRETPGLGDGITHKMLWLNTFIDKTLKNVKWEVKKDGGDFDQFTGATITPRAVVRAVHAGLSFYQKNKNAVLNAAQSKDQ
ncbi:MAG: RnfABCDGE type electron transport complex subunit G [Ghiorsea sp.]